MSCMHCIDSIIVFLEKTLFYLKKERSKKNTNDEEYMMV